MPTPKFYEILLTILFIVNVYDDTDFGHLKIFLNVYKVIWRFVFQLILNALHEFTYRVDGSPLVITILQISTGLRVMGN